MSSCPVPGACITDFLTGRIMPDTGDEMVRQVVEKLLVEIKDFPPVDVEVDRRFALELDGKTESGRADLVVHSRGRPSILIRCAPGSIVSREREALAAARLAYDHPVPFVVVTNGRQAELLDTSTGQVIAEGLDAIPTREQILIMASDLKIEPLDAKRRQMETRVYLAYADYSCEKACGG
ncbi:MAG: type I restriction enzyme HsdR N-terminal domain-containing protein [Deltaproteobacteria bacterium]|nr:type I restriction enzyme HsdR N-terminal domain-containing protein [Deltaproteobacteria bacterium]